LGKKIVANGRRRREAERARCVYAGEKRTGRGRKGAGGIVGRGGNEVRKKDVIPMEGSGRN